MVFSGHSLLPPMFSFGHSELLPEMVFSDRRPLFLLMAFFEHQAIPPLAISSVHLVLLSQMFFS